ncbi:MAG: hypothetical protein MJ211_02610 [Bacteroidales bacterium]|nr:hypothetical protein [Bacteroidales bacterium]
MNNNIIIGQGIGPARFGMSNNEIIEFFGKPNEIEKEQNGEINSITMFYDDLLTDFVCELDEDNIYKLTSILVSNPDYVIDNKIHFGDSEEQLIKYTKSLKAENPQIEIDQAAKEKYLYFDDLNMLAIFDQEGLATIQIGMWDDEDEDENN